MLEPLLKNYDINLIKEAKLYAEKYDVVYILDLIDKFMAEKEDITNKRAKFSGVLFTTLIDIENAISKLQSVFLG
ncbi:MAG: hypothetical protein ACE5J3_00835 [Methanosarcinales archaeon]